MLSIKDLSIETRYPVLQHFSYQFEPNHFYQIAAENGAGKTSFLRAITSLIPITSGKVLVDGKDYIKNKQKVFYFESSDWLDGNLSSLDYLKFVKAQWQSNADLNKEMQFLGINEYSTLPVKKYSLGMKQKLIVTMYLVSGAKYFLMDEITNGLDEESRLILYNRLEKEVIEKKKCIILTSHYSSEINVKNLHRLVFQNKLMHEV